MKQDTEPGAARVSSDTFLGNADLLRRIVDQAPIAMALVDEDGRWIYANPALARLIGLSLEDCIGLKLENIAGTDDRENIRRFENEGEEAEHRYVSKDGSAFFGLTRLSRLDQPVAGQAPIRAILQIDVTARRRAEGDVAEAEQRWRLALQGSQQVVWDFDVPNGVVWVSPHWRTLLDLPDDERIHHISQWLSKMHPDDRDRLAEAVEEVRRNGNADFEATYRLKHHTQGHWIWVLSRGRVVEYAEDGSIQRMIGTIIDISREKERDHQLAEVTERLELAVESGGIGIFSVDYPSGIRKWDARTCELHGTTPETFDGTVAAFDRLLHPEDAARVAHLRDTAFGGRSRNQMDYRVLLPSGAVRHIRVSGRIFHTADGRLARVIGACWDITEDVLRSHSELRWQFALDGSGDGIWDWDIRAGSVFYSRPWKAMLGYEEHEVGPTLQEWSSRVHPDDLPRSWEIVGRHIRGEIPDFAFEHRMRAKDGSWRWILDRGKVVERASDGAPLRMIGTHTDITARKEAEAAIMALNQRLQLAIESSGAGIFGLDFAAEHYDWDERMYEIYDLPPEGYDGTLGNWLRFIEPGDVPEVMRKYEEAVHETSTFSMDFRIRRQRSGTLRHIRSLARVIRDEVGVPLRAVGMNWDITDHKELAEALFEEKERLRITLESIGDAVISTDAEARITFMNPIAEHMTGWPAAEAAGRRLREVFRIVDEITGEAIPDPVEICLARMQPFYLSESAILLSRDGERRSVRDSAAPVRTASGDVIGAVLVFQDVTKARALQQALEYSANHDSLTGLPNRQAFESGLHKICEEARQQRQEHVLCFIDLDRFKVVNDGAGHAAGDALLREVANHLRRVCRPDDLMARLGGDEFALLFRDCGLAAGEIIARRFLRSLKGLKFAWSQQRYQIGASMGLTKIDADSPQPDELMSQADIACYTAKNAGRNQISIYADQTSEAYRSHREVQVAAGIRSAIKCNRFRLFAQEVRSLAPEPDATRHFEILLRMLDEAGTLIEPKDFIPAFEHYDLMGTVDRWVIRTTFQAYGQRLRAASDVTVAINISANSLTDPFLWPFLQEQIIASGVPPGRLRLEITETAIINNLAAAKQFLSKARTAGCGVILDDFGTGLSSFSYLRQFPVDGLKIDGGFITQLSDSEIDRAIVESINDIGHRLGALTVAEQVEDEETLEVVRAIGIDQAQGFAIARPRPFDEIF